MRSPTSLALLCSLSLVFLHCGPAQRSSTVEVVELPSYTPEQSALFDDEFDHAALHGGAWSPDARFGERVFSADGVVVARIQTASENPGTTSQGAMVIDAVPVAMLSGRLNEGSIQLVLSRSSPSYRLFRWQLGVVLGKQVVLLYRNYAQDGETRVHFRAEPNTPAVHAAIQQALATPSGGT